MKVNNISPKKQAETTNENENQPTNKNQNKNGLNANVYINDQYVNLDDLVETVEAVFPNLTFGREDN